MLRQSSWWPRGGVGRILITSLIVVLLMVVSRHYLPSVHESAEKVVSQYAPDIHLQRPPKDEPQEAYVDDSDDSASTGNGSPYEPPVTSIHAAKEPAPTASSKLKLRGCPVIPSSADYLVSMKTGATELFAKLPEQLLTTLRCVPNYMIFSDLEQEMGDYHIYSSLEDVSDSYKYSHRDFSFYRRLLDLYAKGQDLSLLQITKQAEGSAWDLDKWEFIPITHKVYREQPHVKWYIFLEADSYMAWSNVLKMLALYDPEEPWYLGAPHYYGDIAFAHGGMGYMISNGAMRLLDKIYDHKHILEWERRVSESCCGDVELAVVLQEAGINITGIPGLYGESLAWFEWDEGRWCEPALSWHHVRAHDVEALWQFETKLLSGGSSHYVYRDLFHQLVEPHLAASRDDWDNMSRDRIYTGPTGRHGDEDRRYMQEIRWEDLEEDEREDIWKGLEDEQKASIEADGIYRKDTRWDELSEEQQALAWTDLTDIEKTAHESLPHCRAACEDWSECMQFWFMASGRCHLHRTVRLGHYMETGRRVTVDEDTGALAAAANGSVAGWMMERVRGMKERAEECRSVPEWIRAHAEEEGIALRRPG
ncbi:hypothetical protein B0A55_05594 [Friedmanniomyces simplex]|uniref:N-acetylgalactosaminide beta-1,3-galactosyltransferase n=1 Tax=Friedmanniomyces simplex TaxID=329884 RepID=A0A4U0XGF3_9PEZI|nr:hypothetical protein B0A55_05594 [Friedmanniomyces simplex]